MARMSRIAWIVAASLVLALSGSWSLGEPGVVAVAHAKARKKKGGGGGGGGTANKKAVTELMAGFKFDMTRKEVMAKIRKEITERYDAKIFATNDVYQQDKLRREREQEISRIEKSYVEFTGKIAGWDVSVIDDQFKHNTGESMLVYWEAGGGRKQRRFFFFHEDRLYKMLITLDASQIDKERRTFDVFKGALERDYGPSKSSPQGAMWSGDNGIVLFALDKLTHYDTVCLAVTDMRMTRKLLEVRASREEKVEQQSPIIKAMIGGKEDQQVDLKKNADTIDRVLEDDKKQ
jgi:hypothetical protein